MQWSVNDIYNFTKYLTRKNQAGSISATDLFYAWNNEQHAYQSDLLGKWQLRNNGKEGNNIGLIQDETIMTKLTPFTKNVVITLNNSQAEKPENFIYALARRIQPEQLIPTQYLLNKINHGQIYYVNNDVIDGPSLVNKKFYCVEYENYYQILPSLDLAYVYLDYIVRCEDIRWGYTLDDNNRQVYNAGTSVQPLWDTPTIIEITKRTLTSFGVSFKDKDFEMFGEKNTITGDS